MTGKSLKSNRKKRFALLSLLLALAALCLLFYFSGQDGATSQGVSHAVTEQVLRLLGLDATSGNIKLCNYILRRLAHFGLFLLLGFGMSGALACYVKRWGLPIALAAGIAVAVLNEAHQLTMPGRSARVQDVLLDSAGALTGCVLFWGIAAVVRKCKANR